MTSPSVIVSALSGAVKGGLGTASIILESGITVAAIVANNSIGSVINPVTGRPWEIGLQIGNEFGEQGKRSVRLPPIPVPKPEPIQNTTIGVVATDAVLTKPQAHKVAQMAHDGMARAIRPAHSMFDGDTLFCLATGEKKLPEAPGTFISPWAQSLIEVGHAAADCVSRAIIHSVLSAKSLAGMTAFCDLEDL